MNRAVSGRAGQRPKSSLDWIAQRLIFVGPAVSPRPALRFAAEEVPEIVWTFTRLLNAAECDPALRALVKQELAGTGWKVVARAPH